jgi:hypothetical protein
LADVFTAARTLPVYSRMTCEAGNSDEVTACACFSGPISGALAARFEHAPPQLGQAALSRHVAHACLVTQDM